MKTHSPSPLPQYGIAARSEPVTITQKNPSVLSQCAGDGPKPTLAYVMNVYQAELATFTGKKHFPFERQRKTTLNKEFREAAINCSGGLSLWDRFVVEKTIWFNTPEPIRQKDYPPKNTLSTSHKRR